MYTQSTNNIKTIIMPIDGVVFNLNEKRYEIYKELCNKHNVTIDKTVFFNQLCNMYDMYNGLPLLEFNNYEELNDYIEDKLYEHVKYNFLKLNDGILEIIHYSNQKNIKIAMLSTHKTDFAVACLKKANIYNKIQYIVGSDSHLSPLPSCTMISSIMRFFEASAEETLVISSFDALTKAANELNTNVMCIDDFVKYNPTGHNYKKVISLYEVFNKIMFEKYESYDMFSSLLGMNKKMNKDELKHRKEVLEKDYANEDSILNIIEHTYSYHLSMLNEGIEEDAKETSDAENYDDIIEEIFGSDYEEVKDTKDNAENIKESHNDDFDLSINTLSEEVSHELSNLISQITSEINIENWNNTDDLKETVKDEIKVPEELNEKTDDIEESVQEHKEQIEEAENKTQEELKQEDQISETKKTNIFVSIFSFLGETLILSIWVLVIGILIYVLFGDIITRTPELEFIPKCLDTYYSYASGCIKWILDSLHSLISFIPNYEQYINSPSLSKVIVLLINLFTSNTVIIGICICIKRLIFKNKKQ